MHYEGREVIGKVFFIVSKNISHVLKCQNFGFTKKDVLVKLITCPNASTKENISVKWHIFPKDSRYRCYQSIRIIFHLR